MVEEGGSSVVGKKERNIQIEKKVSDNLEVKGREGAGRRQSEKSARAMV